ncbi:hypothetical protein JK217_09975 [Gluconobacter kondonii]|uniref:hypothetical protein n=1 Tax=Gluconobacter kondonii TaxID=941463 RepID=UPI001B8B5611|nr:hypothetical protein [Gluconobacter kondonii]MBS1078073.1 hypothetical protein [Gluconobacter kondonii]
MRRLIIAFAALSACTASPQLSQADMYRVQKYGARSNTEYFGYQNQSGRDAHFKSANDLNEQCMKMVDDARDKCIAQFAYMMTHPPAPNCHNCDSPAGGVDGAMRRADEQLLHDDLMRANRNW